MYQICDQKIYNIDKYSKNTMFHDKINELVYIKRHLQRIIHVNRTQ